MIPEGIVDSLWYEVVERCAEFGVEFDVWQDGLGEATLGIREDGLFAATIGGVTFSIPRQVAKTFIVMCIVVALCSLHPNLTVLWSAHRTRTSTMTFQKMKSFAMRPAIRGHLKAGQNQGTAIRDANGEQEIPWANGSRILFGAREQGFGRGFDEVDIEVFDEAQILTLKALEDMVAATNQSRFEHGALLFYMGTPPRPGVDPGEVFSARRNDALEAKKLAGGQDFGAPVQSGDSLYIECSGDPSLDVDDPRQVVLANPSYPHRTPPVAVKRLRKNLPDKDSWQREGLGIWDAVGVRSTISASTWDELKVPAEDAPTDGTLCFAVKFSVDGLRVSVGVALHDDAGTTHVESLGVAAVEDGTSDLAAWLAARWRKASVILIDGKAGAGDLRTSLIQAGVSARRVRQTTTEEVITAHSGFLRAVNEGQLSHLGQPGLDASVRAAGKRDIGKGGGWGWTAVTPDGDVTSLEAVTLARFGAVTGKRKTGDGRTSSGNRTSTTRRAGVR